MKQHITVEQLNELTNKGKQLLRDWWKPQAGDRCWLPATSTRVLGEGDSFIHKSGVKYYPLLSIGQIIEFLDEQKYKGYWINSIKKDAGREGAFYPIADNLCDSLWEAVKEAE